MKKERKYKHTDAFYMKQYKKYTENANVNLFKNFNTFKSSYVAAEREGKTEITKNFIYETNYEISWDTYKAERTALKEHGIKFKKSELLGMTTREFADKFNDEMSRIYHEFKDSGETSKDIKDFMSYYFFGSN